MKTGQYLLSRSIVAAIFIIGSLLMGAAQAELQSTGFKDTDALLEKANELNAEVLAPKSYASADKYYQAARKYRESGRSDTSRKQLVKANTALRNAVEAAQVAQLVFTDALQARERAITADAAQFEPALW